MLKHYPKLRKLWRKARKIKDKNGFITLDRRYKTDKKFEKELLRVLDVELSKLDLNEIQRLASGAFKEEFKKKTGIKFK